MRAPREALSSVVNRVRAFLTRTARSRWTRFALVLLLSAAIVLALAAARIAPEAAPFIASDPSQLPVTAVGVVLGCRPTMPDGRPNRFFEARIRAAAELYRSGKVARLIVSGDNGRIGYDEPSAMRQALVREGVPASNVSRDFAGFRALDSVLRARDVFGLRRLTFVSQRFHVERAVYLARENGMDAYALAAADVGGAEGALVAVREVFSRVVAVLDVKVLHTTPRFGGPR
jgi:SanA protein